MDEKQFASVIYNTLAGNKDFEQLDPAKLGDNTYVDGEGFMVLQYEGISYVVTVKLDK